jgi:hypothetical protein
MPAERFPLLPSPRDENSLSNPHTIPDWDEIIPPSPSRKDLPITAASILNVNYKRKEEEEDGEESSALT